MQASGTAGRPELVLEKTRVTGEWRGAEGLGAPNGSLLQMGSQGQKVLGFNLSPVFSWLGARVG